MALPLVIIGATALGIGALALSSKKSKRRHPDLYAVVPFPDWDYYFKRNPPSQYGTATYDLYLFFRKPEQFIHGVGRQPTPVAIFEDVGPPTDRSSNHAAAWEYAAAHDAELRFSLDQTSSVEPVILDSVDSEAYGGYPEDFWGYKIYLTDNGYETQILWAPPDGDSIVVATATLPTTAGAIAWSQHIIQMMAQLDWGRANWQERYYLANQLYSEHWN